MTHQVPIDSGGDHDAGREGGGIHEVLDDLAFQRLAIVNVVYWGVPGSKQWVLIDAGVPGTASMVRHAVEERFGRDARPQAIVMTHGHFDHVGALEELAEEWDVPVFAHELELPYLDGRASYPPPDPSVGGGLMSALSRFYPRGPVDVSSRLLMLPSDGTIPHMPDWHWVHTPGHTPGHVSLWRERDRTLIAGDAFITTKQESAYAVATQKLELHGPPTYYTQDWDAARDSVERLSMLEPEVTITGHGRALRGEALRDGLAMLAREFQRVAVPEHGTYVDDPATASDRSAYREP
ncbi:MAG TPA: MBL fold metallo-hydrolase [Longimicrobiales bacterium]|nr:MBL fold metallo-hydrolase [Longimicrobiales bacterium]